MSMLNSLQVVASAYGDKLGLTVVPSNRASTDGQRINVVIDEKKPAATWGFLKHEAAHVRYTDFLATKVKYLQDIISQKPILQKHNFSVKQLFSLVNAFEDNRIEYTFVQEYKGAFKTFDEMNKLLIDEGKWLCSYSKSLINSAYQFAAFYAAGSNRGLNYPSCKDLSFQVEADLQRYINTADYLKLKSIVMSSVKSTSTREVIDLSVNFAEVLLSIVLEDKSDDESDGKSDFTSALDIVDKGDLISGILNSSKTKEKVPLNDCSHDWVELPTQGISVDRYNKGINDSGKLLSRINNLTEAKARNKKVLNAKGRKLSKRHISRIPSGNRKVFVKVIDGIKSNAAIYISVDVSGSMNSSIGESTRLNVALEALSALSFAIDRRKGSDLCLTAFNSGVSSIKSFDEHSSVISKVDKMRSKGGTSIMPAMRRGLIELAKVTAKHNRNIMIFITDGTPSDFEEANETVTDIKKSNVEVYALGIGLNDLSKSRMTEMFGSDFVSVNKANEVQNEILNFAHIAV